MKFERYSINSKIKENLKDLGFKRPTDIQFKAIPSILSNEDVLGIAQTGTGKTAAFAIPIIHKLVSQKRRLHPRQVSCLIMVPTRELARQILDVFIAISKGTGLKTICIYGGVDQKQQIDNLRKGAHVLIATPGRMFDLNAQNKLDLSRVDTLVLDEADHMLDMGFIKDIKDVVQIIPSRRQSLFFSATIDKKIKSLAYSIVKKAIRIQISPKNSVAKNVDHSVAYIKMDDKRFFLERFYQENEESKILVFVRTKLRAERVCKFLNKIGIDARDMHGGKDQNERLTNLNDFRESKYRILIATDVSARGIDIPDVEFVVNYDLPEQTDNYVHRVGRTGRGNKKGVAVSFCCPETELELLERIEAYIDSSIRELEISGSDYSMTKDYSEDISSSLKELMEETENFMEDVTRNKKKKKRKK